MKIIARGQNIIISGPDVSDAQVTANGRVWRFDFDDYCGPLWLKADGEPRKCQSPSIKAVRDAFDVWLVQYEVRKAAKKQPKEGQP